MEELELFAITARQIWLRRNKVIHGGIFMHPNQVASHARKSLEEYQNANEAGVESEDNHEPSQSITWQPPPRNLIKVNWDAAVSKKNGRVGIGVIARDSMGKVYAARSLTVGQIFSPVAAEAMAGVHAMLLGKDLNHSGVIIEGDAQQIVSEVNSRTPCMSNYGHLIEDIQDGIRSTSNISVIHTKREANYAAHGLAQFATTHVVDVLWTEEISPCIYGIVRREEVIPLP